MQKYLDHVVRSRSRLTDLVKKFQPQLDVLIRGTVLDEPTPDAFIKAGREIMPVYLGKLGALKPEVAGVLLDATLRKSVSYSLDHLLIDLIRKGVVPRGSRGDFAKSLSGVGSFDVWLGLLLVRFESCARIDVNMDLEGRGIFQFEYVGNESVVTFTDIDARKEKFKRDLNSGLQWFIPYIAFAPWSALVDSAKLAVSDAAVAETVEFNRDEPKIRAIDNRGELITLDEYIICPEGFKSKARRYPSAYRFAIEVEMIMVDKMIKALETDTRCDLNAHNRP